MGLRSVVSKRFGTLLAGVALAIGIIAASAPAEARHGRHYGRHARAHIHVRHYVHIRKHRVRHARAARVAQNYGGPPQAEIVVDANSGRVLFAHNENELRHPASLTKVMTLYMLFEQLEKGKLRLDSELTVTAHGASMAPSKLGLRPGSTIEVEDAIKAIVTKSANDIAATVAEAIGGDEDTFAEMMTRKAHALGMSRTNYANASGLPNPQQITTARDLAILGRAIQDRFPRYYRYFSHRSFTYAGRAHRNHNHLLGRVEGMDGIKTGYTGASGFNLLTSVRRDGHHIVAVVLGGRTGAARDRLMAGLIEEHIDSGAGNRSVASISEDAADDAPAREASKHVLAQAPRVEPRSRIEQAVARAEPEQPRAQAAPARLVESPALRLAVPQAPIELERMRVADKPRPAYIAGAARPTPPEFIPEKSNLRARNTIVADGSTTQRATASASATPSNLRWVRGAPAAGKPHVAETPKLQGKTVVAKADVKKPAVVETRAPIKSGWIIQIGATDDAAKANDLLSRAKGRSRAIASAQPFTEKVQKGHETLWRARFAGLQESSAGNACRDLKRSGFSCIAMKN